MSRHPRAGGAANHRVTFRLTDAELATARRLAEIDASDVSSVVRKLLAAHAGAVDFTDARHTFAPRYNNSTYREALLGAHVFTLHHVPGREEPTCVRRKITRIDGACSLYFEYARGLKADVTTERVLDDGFAITRGYCRHDRYEFRYRRRDGFWGRAPHPDGKMILGVEPRMVVFATCPDAEQRAHWKRANALYQSFISGRRDFVFTCWGGADWGGPLREQKIRIRPNDGGESEHRASYRAQIGRKCFADFDLFEACWHGAEMASVFFGDDDGASTDGVMVRLWVSVPTDVDELFERGRLRDAKRDAMDREVKRRQQQRDREPPRGWKAQSVADFFRAFDAPPKGALDLLGLNWPCTEADLKSAYIAAAKKHHPDKGGDTETMKRVNAAREQIAAAIGRKVA